MDGVEEEEEEEEATLWLEADLPKPLYPADFHLPPKLLLVTPTSPPPLPCVSVPCNGKRFKLLEPL